MAAEFPVPLDNLIAYVKMLHPHGGPLENVADAFEVSAQLDEQADALIGYFVDQARRSGASWSQIGSAMGVSKQAAQKRFVGATPDGPDFTRFTQRAANVVTAAGRLAAADGGATVIPAHLAAALLAEPQGIAALVITAAGLTAEQVYEAVGAGPATPGGNAKSSELTEVEFSPAGRAALKEALKVALRLGHNYIGTEHLLLGLLQAGGRVPEELTALGLTQELAEAQIVAKLAEIQARLTAG
jgi:Clp amino terminal domain, pathogenicity island component